MAYFRRLGVIGILGVSCFVAVACGDDDDKLVQDGEGGEAGESTAGSAGKGGNSQGGSNATAGKGGNATAGKGGNAGSANEGGAAGEGAASGTAGEPPLGGGAGEGGSAGAGGAGGDGGTSGSGGGDAGSGGNAPTAAFCSNPCEIDADCKVGEDASFVCDPTGKFCRGPEPECETHDDCVPSIAFWEPCGVDAPPCFEGYACVLWQGSGRCAPLPFEGFGCGTDETRTVPLFGQQGDEEICVSAGARCRPTGTCFNGCGSQPEFACGFAGGTCDMESGLCNCTASEECPAIEYDNAPVVCQ